jgi:uncharacterized membrane protein
MKRLQRLFVTGLLAIVPLVISLWTLAQVSRFLDQLLGPLIARILKEHYVRGIGFFSLLLLILLTGLLIEALGGQRMIQSIHNMFGRIPLFNKLYGIVKGVSDSVLNNRKTKFFEGVVLVSFPNSRTKTIGFITAVPRSFGEEQVGVFVPTVPNITTGFYLVFPRSDVTVLDMPVEEGIKLVISAGLSARGEKGGAEPGKSDSPDS